jgi:hypothetical protein
MESHQQPHFRALNFQGAVCFLILAPHLFAAPSTVGRSENLNRRSPDVGADTLAEDSRSVCETGG